MPTINLKTKLTIWIRSWKNLGKRKIRKIRIKKPNWPKNIFSRSSERGKKANKM